MSYSLLFIHLAGDCGAVDGGVDNELGAGKTTCDEGRGIASHANQAANPARI